MKLSARIARRTIKARRISLPTRVEVRRTLVRPHSIASHLISSGISPSVAAGMAGSISSVAKRMGILPLVGRTRRTAAGSVRKERIVHRYNSAQAITLVAAYRPRKPEYKTAAQIFLSV